MFEIELEWPVASEYVLRPIGPPKDIAIFPAEGASIVRRRPVEQNPSLYAEFAQLDGSKESCLKFAQRYGLLNIDLTNPGPFYLYNLESLASWRAMIGRVKDIIRRCQLSRANPAEAYRQFGKQDKEVGSVEIYLSMKSPISPITLDFRPTSLINAIELQAVRSILIGHNSIQCIECSRWFEVGGGARRSLSKFCSPRCKDTYHNRLKAVVREARRPRPSNRLKRRKQRGKK
jgi:hypothetical protein